VPFWKNIWRKAYPISTLRWVWFPCHLQNWRLTDNSETLHASSAPKSPPQCRRGAIMFLNRRNLAILIAVDVVLFLWIWMPRWLTTPNTGSPEVLNSTLGVRSHHAAVITVERS